VTVLTASGVVNDIDIQLLPLRKVTPFLAVNGAMSVPESVPNGEPATFRVWPAAGFRVTRVFGDGADAVRGAGGVWTLANVTGDVTLRAEFTEGACHLAAGSTGISGLADVESGSDLTFTVAARSGFKLKSVTASSGDTIVGAGTSWTIHEVSGDATITTEYVRPTSVSLKASASTVKYKKSVKLSGATSGNLAKSTRVEIWVLRPGSTVWARLTTVKTGSTHKWSYSYKLTKKGYYSFQARYAGKTGYEASASSTKRVRCK
jgi:hypothetical protein